MIARKDDRDDPTLAICIRCAQFFPARDRCPHCGKLHISIAEDAVDDSGGTWEIEVWEGESPLGERNRLLLLGGFPSVAEATAQAHEFLRTVVQQRIDQGIGRP
jgi:hypothetical protein